MAKSSPIDFEEGSLAGSLKGTFCWNYSNPKIIERKGIGRELNKKVADIIARYSNPYVPYLQGYLSRNVQTYGAKDHGTISYKMPYAQKQYYGKFKHTTAYHPLATSYWDREAWTNHKKEICAEVDAERKRLSYGE